MRIGKKILKKIIAEETEKVFSEKDRAAELDQEWDAMKKITAGINKKALLIACGIFAQKYIKGKEGQQLPITIMCSNKQEVDDYFSGGKEGKERKLKRGKKGAITAQSVRIYHKKNGDRNVKLTSRSFMTSRNKINNMLDAVSGGLLFAKGNSNFLDQKNPYIKKLIAMARLAEINMEEKWGHILKIAMKTEVAGDSFVESTSDSIRTTGEKDSKSFGGGKMERNILVTTVEYLVGPLGTQKPGSFAGLQAKAKAQHDQKANAFGDKGVLGAVRAAFRHSELGGGGLDDESKGEFDRKLDKAMPADDDDTPQVTHTGTDYELRGRR